MLIEKLGTRFWILVDISSIAFEIKVYIPRIRLVRRLSRERISLSVNGCTSEPFSGDESLKKVSNKVLITPSFQCTLAAVSYKLSSQTINSCVLTCFQMPVVDR